MIWEFALPAGWFLQLFERTLRITRAELLERDEPGKYEEWQEWNARSKVPEDEDTEEDWLTASRFATSLASNFPIPELSLACNESYDVASKIYESVISFTTPCPYVNFDRDTILLHSDYLCFPYTTILDDIYKGWEFGEVKNLAIHLHDDLEHFDSIFPTMVLYTLAVAMLLYFLTSKTSP